MPITFFIQYMNKSHKNKFKMKTFLSIFIVIAISSLANANDCFRYCWWRYLSSSDFDSYNNCLGTCPSGGGSRSSNEAKSIKKSSLRGPSALLEYLVGEAKKENGHQDVDLIQDNVISYPKFYDQPEENVRGSSAALTEFGDEAKKERIDQDLFIQEDLQCSNAYGFCFGDSDCCGLLVCGIFYCQEK